MHCVHAHNACWLEFRLVCCTFMCVNMCDLGWRGWGGLQVARPGVLPRKQNALGWGRINESGEENKRSTTRRKATGRWGLDLNCDYHNRLKIVFALVSAPRVSL